MILNGLILFISAQHLLFLILEMFLWTKPAGLKFFKMNPEQAEATSVLAKNQGLYNGFLAAGLIWSLVIQDPTQALSVKIFFLSCVAIAGIYGGITASAGIFFIQALPALITLGVIWKY